MLKPKLFTCLKDYNRDMFFKDVIAGIIVAIIALPLSIALAIASGVSPEKGLITACIGGFFVSLLGGSRVQIGGPTGAFVVIVSGIVYEYGLDGLIISTMMAGAILVFMGLFRLGDLIKFIPYPVTTGFTSGIAVVIFSTQINDFMGLGIEKVPSEFLGKWGSYIHNIGHVNWMALAVGLVTMGIIVLWPKVNAKIPGAFVALILTTFAALFMGLNIATIETQFGTISGAIPMPSMPVISLDIIKALFMPAVAIALLGSIESLLSAVIADGMIGGNHRSNMELVGQGVANMASALFGGIPVTGAIARTAANVKNGGRTPVAGIVHAITVFLMLIILMPYIKYVPMASLAGILIIVAYNMVEWDSFRELNKCPKSDALVFLATFFLTVVFDLVVAIEVGMILSAFLFMKRMSDVTDCHYTIGSEENSCDKFGFLNGAVISPEIGIYEINGPFFFGAADKFLNTVKSIEKPPRILILKMTHVPVIDATGYAALNRLYEKCEKYDMQIIIGDLQTKTYDILERYGFVEQVGRESICHDMKAALDKANGLLDHDDSKGSPCVLRPELS